jgi:hypothetical protein
MLAGSFKQVAGETDVAPPGLILAKNALTDGLPKSRLVDPILASILMFPQSHRSSAPLLNAPQMSNDRQSENHFTRSQPKFRLPLVTFLPPCCSWPCILLKSGLISTNFGLLENTNF